MTPRLSVALFALSQAAWLLACPSIDETALPDPPAVVEVHPTRSVGLHDSVELSLSRPVRPLGTWSMALMRSDGRSVPHRADLAEDGLSIHLGPEEAWPAGDRIEIRLAASLVDEEGRSIVPPGEPLSFETVAGEPLSASFVLRAPPPNRPAPINLRSLTVAVVPPEAAIERAFLVSPAHRIEASIAGRSAAGLIRLELPEADEGEACAPLCASARYRVELTGPRPIRSALGDILTATVADRIPPVITSTAIEIEGASFAIVIGASEPIRVRGTLDTGAERRALEGPLVPSELVRVRSPADLAAGTRLRVRLEGEDAAYNRLAPVDLEIELPPKIEVMVTELVPTPLRDWSDSVPDGEPFDDEPGGGAVTDGDEWIELVNLSDQPIDLTRLPLVLRTLDGTPAETRLDAAPVLRFTDGGSVERWWPGEALVVRPRGSMAQTDLVVELSTGARIVDRVVIGEDNDADHVGGRPPDLLHDALARDAQGRLRWCAPTPGDPVPPVDCKE